MLQLDPERRVGLLELLNDPYFNDIRDLVIGAPPVLTLDCHVTLLDVVRCRNQGHPDVVESAENAL